MQPKTEEFLNLLLWSADLLARPTFRNLTDSYESWAYRNGLLRQVTTLERQQLLERDASSPDDRLYRLSARGRLHVLGGRDPEERWARPWDGQWRLVLFDVPTGQNAQRERLRRYLRDKGFGYVQNSVWITPDPLTEERQILGGGKINVESLLLLEARPCAGESDAEIVAGAWDFERINRRYARHLKILGERPGGALRNDASAKSLLRWAAAEREAWLEAVTNPESFRGCCRAGFCRPITWGNRRGGGGWKCSGTPAGNCARSNPNSPVQNFVAYATKVRHGRGQVTSAWFRFVEAIIGERCATDFAFAGA